MLKLVWKGALNSFVTVVFLGGCYFWIMIGLYVIGGCK